MNVPGDWTLKAACRNQPSHLFFPERGESCEPGRQVCAACPVREACLEYAMRHHIVLGIWGGTSERERRTLRRTWSAA